MFDDKKVHPCRKFEYKSPTMTKIVFAFPPSLGDCAEICLVVASAGGLPTRLRERMFVFSPYVELVQIKNRHFKPHDTMALLLHGISSSMVTYALPPPLH